MAASGGLQGLALFSPGVAEVDPEELYNAGVAWMVGHGHADALFRMQYREFCGGCSLDALIAAPLLRVLGPWWLAWKLVPLAFTALLAGAGTWLMDRSAGRPAALAFAGLLALAPRAWQHLSLIGWGNHVEAGIIGTLGLLLAVNARRTRTRLFAGGMLGAAVWIGFSGVFAPVAALAVLLARRQRAAALQVALGIPLGLLPWAAQYASTGLHPFVTVYQDGETAPALARIPHKLATLFAPGQLVALLGLPHSWVGHGLGWAAAVSVAVAIGATVRNRARGLAGAALAGLAAWTAIYLVVRFQVYDPPWPEIAVPGSVRYAAPAYPLLMVILAATAGRWWSEGARLPAITLVIPLALGGAAARLETAAGAASPTRVAGLGAVHWEHFRPQFSYTLSNSEHLASADDDRWSRRAHAYALGRNDAGMKLRNPEDGTLRRVARPEGVLARPWWQGVGEALVDQIDDETDDSREMLDRARILLSTAPGADPAGVEAALRAAAWVRREATDHPAATVSARGTWREGAGSLQTRAALAWAHARDLGRARVGWHGQAPDSLVAEALAADCPGATCNAAVEGLAMGLAEELGPLGISDLEPPGGRERAWQQGLEAAWTLWWPDADTF